MKLDQKTTVQTLLFSMFFFFSGNRIKVKKLSKNVISEWVKLAIKAAYLKQGKTSPEALAC